MNAELASVEEIQINLPTVQCDSYLNGLKDVTSTRKCLSN